MSKEQVEQVLNEALNNIMIKVQRKSPWRIRIGIHHHHIMDCLCVFI